MTLDLSPAPGASSRTARLLGHARIEASLLLRNGEQLILALVIPVALLVGGLTLGGRMGLDPTAFPASVLALALWSTAFTSLAIGTGFERRYGVLERLVATPLTRGDLVAGKSLATAAIALAQLAVLAAIALALGWRPTPNPAQTLVALIAVPLAVPTFAAWALALAGRLRAEATLASANLIYLAVAALGAVVLPVAAYPDWAQPILRLLPPAALAETLRAWASGGLDAAPLAVLAPWLALSLLVARKAFRWTS